MARCTLSRALDAPQFWATVYDQLTTDFVETAAMKESLGRLTLKSLIVQCKADGVDVATIERCMDSHSDPIPDLCKACIDATCGGTIDIGGQEVMKELRPRSLDRGGPRVIGTARHASSPPVGALPPRKKYWKNFDPTEGEATFRLGQGIKIGTVVNVIEVRRGTVLGYLTEGNYTGEQTFLDSDTVRYPSHVTAMEHSELLFLTRDSLQEVKDEFPEVQSSIQNALHVRENSERQRRLFNDAARGDDSLSIQDMHKLLTEKLFFSEKDLKTVQIDHSGDSIDEFEFVRIHWLALVAQ